MSRGEAIGTTDLGFVRVLPDSRMGWFQPNEAGHRVMPDITSVIPAMRAFKRSDGRPGRDGPIPWAELVTSTDYADLTEAMHRVGALDLSVHREDGTVIPTGYVGIQDTEQLLELARIDDAMLGIDERWLDAGGDVRPGELEPWNIRTPNPCERYQITVLLVDGADVP